MKNIGPLVLALLLAAFAVAAASRRDDMRRDAEQLDRMLAEHGSFEAWSRSLHDARERFNRTPGNREKLFSHTQFGNFVEAMKSIHAACEERGLDFLIFRVPTAAERVFAAGNAGKIPDPYCRLMQKMLADEGVELVDPLLPGSAPLAERLRRRYPREDYARKVLVFGRPEDCPGTDADFLAFSGGGAYLASDLLREGGKLLDGRPAVVFAAPTALFYRESAVLPAGTLLQIPETAYRPAGTWDAANWQKLGFEPVPDRDDPFFRITADGLLRIAPLLAGEKAGMAGSMRLALPDPPGSALRVVLTLDAPAELEVRALCGRDEILAGVFTDRQGSRVELHLRPTWLSRILTLKFHVKGTALLREIRLYSAP